MKIRYLVLPVLILMLIQACAPASFTPRSPASDSSSQGTTSQPEPAVPPTDDPSQSDSISQPIVMTVLPGSTSSIGSEPATPTSDPNVFFTGDVTLANQGQTINLHVGDSFLLNLGDDQYTWSASVDNDSIIHLKMGVMVIKGAQGIYDALAPGTATLTATGDPLCRQSAPPCAMPSQLFTVTIFVK